MKAVAKIFGAGVARFFGLSWQIFLGMVWQNTLGWGYLPKIFCHPTSKNFAPLVDLQKADFPTTEFFIFQISVKIKKFQYENIIQKNFGRVAWQNILKGGVAKIFGGMVPKYFGRWGDQKIWGWGAKLFWGEVANVFWVFEFFGGGKIWGWPKKFRVGWLNNFFHHTPKIFCHPPKKTFGPPPPKYFAMLPPKTNFCHPTTNKKLLQFADLHFPNIHEN